MVYSVVELDQHRLSRRSSWVYFEAILDSLAYEDELVLVTLVASLVYRFVCLETMMTNCHCCYNSTADDSTTTMKMKSMAGDHNALH